LERGADINVKNYDGDTPLISAAIGAAAMRARFLESLGVENNDKGRALCAKLLCRRLEFVRVLLLVWMFGNRPSLAVRPSI
jgi:ankyrin repeat protein